MIRHSAQSQTHAVNDEMARTICMFRKSVTTQWVIFLASQKLDGRVVWAELGSCSCDSIRDVSPT